MPPIKSGRGWFSDWFITERERDILDLRALHDEVEEWYSSSLLADDDALIDTLCKLVSDIHNATQSQLNIEIAKAIAKPLETLLETEFFRPPLIEDDDWDRIDLVQRARLRRDLSRWRRFSLDWQHRFDLGCNRLFDVGAMVLGQTTRLPASGQAAPVLSFNTSLIDQAENPGLLISGILHELITAELKKAELFLGLRNELNDNMLRASGIDPEGKPSNRAIILPKDAKDQTPTHLVDAYLRGTALADLLEVPVSIPIQDKVRFEHAHVLGGTGHGKTQLLQYLISHDLDAALEDNRSIIVIDGQGDMIRTIMNLSCFDPSRENSLCDRLVLIDPDDIEHPACLNIFAVDQERIEEYDLADRERVLNGVVDLFEYMFTALLGAELTQKQGVVFRYLAQLMLVIPNASIQTLRELMEDGRKYAKHMQALEGSAKHFFQTEFFSRSFGATKQQILRRLWGVLSIPVFERMFSHPENRVDIFKSINSGKIILINTAKDLLKPEGSSILGRFFIAKIAQAALERATLDPDERSPCVVYVDEAHDYFDDRIEHLFNQARKYKVGLTIAHQNLDQLSTKQRSTIMASTSLKFVGGASARDAKAMAEDMNSSPDFIRAMRKRPNETEFAASIKNQTPRALRARIPLGFMEAKPQLSEEARNTLIDNNRASYCSTLEEINALIAKSVTDKVKNPERSDTRSEPTKTQSFKVDTQQSTSPPPPYAAPVTQPPDSAPPVKPPQPPEDTYLEGLGSRQHKQLQQYVRSIGQSHGFKATIEKPTTDRSGNVDIALEHEDLSIAVEVSISTETKHEIHNVEKCFAAGYDRVILLVSDPAKQSRLAKKIPPELKKAQRKYFRVFGPDAFNDYMMELAASLATNESNVLGYRVRTVHKAGSAMDAKHRREIINKTLSQSINPKKN